METRATALVPMKDHSVRVQGKNTRLAGGVPLFYHVLRTLEECEAVATVVVDTDSPRIVEMLAADFPDVRVIDRPEALRGPDVPMNAVIEHDLSVLDGQLFLQTHSTNPLLSAATIDAAVRAFATQDEHDSLYTVTRVQKRFFDAAGQPVNHDPSILLNTQDLPPLFEENSCLYVFTRDSFTKRGNRLGVSPWMYEIDKLEAIDIDDEVEFGIVKLILDDRAARGAATGFDTPHAPG